MDDTDREDEIEAVDKGQIIGARPHDLDRRKPSEVTTRAGERALVDIDRTAFARPIGHRPQAVAPHAAADVEKALPSPISRRQMDGPTAELLLVFGQNLGIGASLIAETVGRAAQIARN